MRKNSPIGFILLGIVAILLVLPACSLAQDAKLELFEGGKIDGTFRIRSFLFSGAGVHGALSGLTAPVYPQPFNVFGNPASLTRIEGNKVGLGFTPKIDFNIPGLYDPSDTINEEVDGVLDTFKKSGPIEYPEVTGRIGRGGSSIYGLAATFSFDEKQEKWFGTVPRLLDRIAIGYYQPLYVQFETVYSGLRMRIRTIDEDNPEGALLFYSSIKLSIDAELTADNWAISGARQFDKVSAGFGVTRTEIGIDLSARHLADGILSMAENERAFGDPNDPWSEDKGNEYSSDANGRLSGTSWGVRLGGNYQPWKWLLLGADLKLQNKAILDGPLDMELHRFMALNINAAPGEDKFNANLVDPQELTRTFAKYFETTSDITVEIPSAISVGASIVGKVRPGITFTKYFGELSYSMDLVEITETSPEEYDSTMISYKRGFKPDWNLLFSLDLAGFKLAAGAAQLADVVEGYKDGNGAPIKPMESTIVPRFSIGWDMRINDYMTLNTLLVGLPEDMVRFGIRFDL